MESMPSHVHRTRDYLKASRSFRHPVDNMAWSDLLKIIPNARTEDFNNEEKVVKLRGSTEAFLDTRPPWSEKNRRTQNFDSAEEIWWLRAGSNRRPAGYESL